MTFIEANKTIFLDISQTLKVFEVNSTSPHETM